MTSLKRIRLWLLGPRDYPEAVVTLPEHLVADLPNLIARARTFNPALATDSIVQATWRLGSYRLGQNLLRQIPIKLAELPLPGKRLSADRLENLRAEAAGQNDYGAGEVFRPSAEQIRRRAHRPVGRRGGR